MTTTPSLNLFVVSAAICVTMLFLSAAKRLYPRWLVKTAFRNHGMGMQITATK